MKPPKLLDTVKSKVDKTVKYVFGLEDGLITEVAYIDKDDGKDILCVSSQTGCRLGCLFCHTTDIRDKITTRNLKKNEIFHTVKIVYEEQNLKQKQRMLLVSYMGCGEPLLNYNHVCESMRLITREFSPCRFAIATLIPSNSWFEFCKLCFDVKMYRLPVKVHLSLHFTELATRKVWMPAANGIGESIALLEFYSKQTGNSVEIHYALISDMNDRPYHAKALASLLKGRQIPVKLLRYNKREVIKFGPSDRTQEFMEVLTSEGIEHEYYEPPGQDVGSSCGSFLLDHYLKHNKK